MMLLTIFALVSFRQIPLQLFGSCVEPLPLKSVVSFVECHEGKSVFRVPSSTLRMNHTTVPAQYAVPVVSVRNVKPRLLRVDFLANVVYILCVLNMYVSVVTPGYR